MASKSTRTRTAIGLVSSVASRKLLLALKTAQAAKDVRECGAARSRCEWLRDSPRGGHLSFVAASNAAGPTATAAGPGSLCGPHQLQLLSLYLSLYSTDYLTDHSSPSETSLTVREDLPSKLDTESCGAGLRSKFSRPVSKRVSSCFLRETFFLSPFGRGARSGSELFYYYRIVPIPHSTSFRSTRSALGPQPV